MSPNRAHQIAAGVAGLAAVGTLLLAIAHTGVDVPLLSALGPSGGAVPPAVVGFGIGAVVFGAIGFGLWRGAPWARWLGLAVSALAIVSGLAQFRGVVSAIGIAVAVLLGALLLAPDRSPSSSLG